MGKTSRVIKASLAPRRGCGEVLREEAEQHREGQRLLRSYSIREQRASYADGTAGLLVTRLP